MLSPQIEFYAHLCAKVKVKVRNTWYYGLFSLQRWWVYKKNVSIELLEFPLCIKNKILRIKDITKPNIEYISGKNIIFKNTNLELIEHIKLLLVILKE